MILPFAVFIGLASAVAAATTTPPLARRVLHEGRSAVPRGWNLHRRADPDMVLPLSIALRQSNIDMLDEYLLEVSDPASPKYGQLWTAKQIAKTFRPSQESVDAVQAWLLGDGVDMSRTRFSKDGGYLLMNVTVSEAERLLATQYHVYQHTETGKEHVGCHQGYHLPEHLTAHVDLVTPTVEFGGVKLAAQLSRRTQERRASAESGTAKMKRPNGAPKWTMDASDVIADATMCDQQVTLDCIRALYDFYPNLTMTDKNTAGVVELADQTFVADDLKIFFQKFAPDLANIQPILRSIDGGFTNFSETDPNLIGESDLDFELFMGLLGAQQPVQLYQVGGSGSFNLLLDGFDGGFCAGDDPDFDFFNGTEDCGDIPPSFVYSLSYAGAEDFPTAYMQRQCTEYGKLGMMGMSFFFASGDNGVASNSDDFCLSDNGTVVVGLGNFLPNFPATCPYVTAVGSTQLPAGSSVTDPETASFAFPSGGGFSNVFPIPSFQTRAVSRYLSRVQLDLGPNVFNRSGRGVPDVSTNGFPTAVVIDGNFTITGGTSASTPIFAAMIAAINDARLAAGKKPVGWINPALYSHRFAGAFNDITVGNNSGCGHDGFPTARGWDPVTGLGTPKFPKLLQRFLALP